MEHLGRCPVAQGLIGPQVIVEPEVFSQPPASLIGVGVGFQVGLRRTNCELFTGRYRCRNMGAGQETPVCSPRTSGLPGRRLSHHVGAATVPLATGYGRIRHLLSPPAPREGKAGHGGFGGASHKTTRPHRHEGDGVVVDGHCVVSPGCSPFAIRQPTLGSV